MQLRLQWNYLVDAQKQGEDSALFRYFAYDKAATRLT